MRQAVIGLGRLTARRLCCSKNQKPGRLGRHRASHTSATVGEGRGFSSAALFLTSKLKTIGSERPFRGAFLFGVMDDQEMAAPKMRKMQD
jgi:hypothetical protein